MMITDTIQALIDQGALFAINHSGGKDSQAMMIELLKVIPARQLVVVHADLGDVEWQGTQEHARAQADAAGIPFIVARATNKTLLSMVENRFATRPEVPSWPGQKHRQCTSDLKRDPINRELGRYAKANGFTTIVSCQGIRAAESVSRSKKKPFKPCKRLTTGGRTGYEWYPIFNKSTIDVFLAIEMAGQEPHWAYAAGNERLSCVFCIFGSPTDLANGARHRPELAQRYIGLEHTTGYTMHVSRRPLAELIAEGEALLTKQAA
jgi:3'-phosphoadenosine 5'-phosphosulfate sulfotransferase (PAPS reductase)/FAD synthetase